MTGTAGSISPRPTGATLLASNPTTPLLASAGTWVDVAGLSFTAVEAGLYRVTAEVRAQLAGTTGGGAWVSARLLSGAIDRRVMAAYIKRDAALLANEGSETNDDSGTIVWVGQLAAGATMKAQAILNTAAEVSAAVVISDVNGFSAMTWERLGA